MANTSAFFDLILPGKGEYRDTWQIPVNANFTTIDTWAQAIDLEIVAARFSKTSLSEFLAVGHDVDGNLLSTPEVNAATISPIYGFQTPDPELFDLTTRVSQVEWEVWYAREAQANLRKAFAARMPAIKSQILECKKDVDNLYPAWLGYTGANAHIDGSDVALWLSIDGKLCRERTLRSVAISGAAGTKYLYAQYLEDFDAGKIVVAGEAVPPATPNGTTGFDVNNYPIYFSDITKDFTTLDVEVGDVLTLIDSADKGNYVLKEIAPGAVISQLTIIGQFPTGGISSINYNIYDPLRMSFGYDSSEVPAEGKYYIGEVDFDGSAITAVRARHFRDTFISEWREISVTTTFEEIFEHNLGSDVLDISVQARLTNSDAEPIEELSLTTITRNLNLSLSSSGLTLDKTSDITFNQGTLPSFTEGTYTHTDPDPTGSFSHPVADSLNPGSLPSLSGEVVYELDGNVTGSITGDVYTDSSVKVKWNKSKLWVKNAEIGKFYKTYSGTATTTGYLRVIVRKRG